MAASRNNLETLRSLGLWASLDPNELLGTVCVVVPSLLLFDPSRRAEVKALHDAGVVVRHALPREISEGLRRCSNGGGLTAEALDEMTASFPRWTPRGAAEPASPGAAVAMAAAPIAESPAPQVEPGQSADLSPTPETAATRADDTAGVALLKERAQRGEHLDIEEVEVLARTIEGEWAADTAAFEAKSADAEERAGIKGFVPPLEPHDGDDHAPTSVPLRFRRAADLIGEPHAGPIVEGVAWPARITVLVSESGAGKTFALLGLSASVDEGASWHGRETVRGSVAYISYEGDAIGLRLQALREAGHALEDVHVLRASDPISPRLGRDGLEGASLGEADVTEQLAALRAWIAAEGRPPVVLVVIDTVRASMTGSEDSSEYVSAYLRAARRVMVTAPEAGCILAHHAGWQDSTETRRRRERGSSAFRGNVDATLYLEVTEDLPEEHAAYLTLRTLKVRDDERPAPLRLKRCRVALSRRDRHGQPMTSCLIETDARRREDLEAEAAAEVDAQARELDRQTLRAIAEHPEVATSKDGIRELIGIGKPAASASVARLIRAGLILPPGRRGQPYTPTPAGILTLRDSGPKRTEADRGPAESDTVDADPPPSIGAVRGPLRTGAQRGVLKRGSSGAVSS